MSVFSTLWLPLTANYTEVSIDIHQQTWELAGKLYMRTHVSKSIGMAQIIIKHVVYKNIIINEEVSKYCLKC